MFQNLMEALKVEKAGRGAAQTWPDRAMAGKSYSAWAIRQYLREPGIQCAVPGREDQKANRKRKGQAGRRPVTYSRDAYKRHKVVEYGFNALNQWRSPATRYDKLALTYRSAVVLHAVLI